MDQEKYLNDKLLWASHFLKENVGLKLSYNQNDVFKVLTKFGYVENTSKFYRMYAIRMGRHFNLFVVSFNKQKEPDSYYSVTISDETLDICYILELMTKQH